ncbi:eamA-like transporter family protein [Burkholderia pseudomallei MSHR7500]|uniref:DMT family transporter n=1 Tax=Burkholderia pseudomallei TaxID=28450 RepID=UPI0005310AA3|nr:DMT family transporter [Burkholderia pseudomallei]KGS79170.1 eamA-like transporter family protein [Burkholderia pseudomallei MSHR7500]
MAILMGLLSALCWGSTDFLAGHAARRVGVTKSLFYSQSFGFLILTASLALHPSSLRITAIDMGFAVGILAAVCNLIAMAALLRALAIGKASVVAPIVSLYGAMTTILSLATGQSITRLAIAGLVLCIVGASLASISKAADGRTESPASIGFALLSAMMFGLGFWLQGAFAVKSLGVVSALWIYYLTAVVILFATLARARNLSAPPGSIVLLILSISVFSLVGFFSLAYGSTTGHVAIVTVLSSLASGVTALLGFFVRGERPSALQWAGIATIIVGVVMLKITPQALAA